jgi:hypothetical protein
MDAARVARILHGALLAGLALAGAVLAMVRRVGHVRPLEAAPTIGLALAGVAFVLLAVAIVVLRPRMPERRADQSADAYWMAGESRGAAIVLWSVVQAAGLVASVASFVTGATAPIAVAAAALIVLFMFRPSRFDAA